MQLLLTTPMITPISTVFRKLFKVGGGGNWGIGTSTLHKMHTLSNATHHIWCNSEYLICTCHIIDSRNIIIIIMYNQESTFFNTTHANANIPPPSTTHTMHATQQTKSVACKPWERGHPLHYRSGSATAKVGYLWLALNISLPTQNEKASISDKSRQRRQQTLTAILFERWSTRMTLTLLWTPMRSQWRSLRYYIFSRLREEGSN